MLNFCQCVLLLQILSGHGLQIYQITALQGNGYDFGMWVIAQHLAVISGFKRTEGSDADMINVRDVLRRLGEHALVCYPKDLSYYFAAFSFCVSL